MSMKYYTHQDWCRRLYDLGTLSPQHLRCLMSNKCEAANRYSIEQARDARKEASNVRSWRSPARRNA